MAETDSDLEMVTVAQLGRLLKVSRYWIYDQIERGRLPARRIGKAWRIRRADVALLWVEEDT